MIQGEMVSNLLQHSDIYKSMELYRIHPKDTEGAGKSPH